MQGNESGAIGAIAWHCCNGFHPDGADSAFLNYNGQLTSMGKEMQAWLSGGGQANISNIGDNAVFSPTTMQVAYVRAWDSTPNLGIDTPFVGSPPPKQAPMQTAAPVNGFQAQQATTLSAPIVPPPSSGSNSITSAAQAYPYGQITTPAPSTQSLAQSHTVPNATRRHLCRHPPR
jgi:hypothetical protein